MVDQTQHALRLSQSDMPSRVEAHDAQTLLQALHTTLTNIDLEYGKERERLIGRTKDENLKTRLLEKLKQQHQQRREPYVQQLAVLHQRMRQRAD